MEKGRRSTINLFITTYICYLASSSPLKFVSHRHHTLSLLNASMCVSHEQIDQYPNRPNTFSQPEFTMLLDMGSSYVHLLNSPNFHLVQTLDKE